MNYIYDILINYNNNLYDIYDWNKEDTIIHIRKIPVFKLDTNILLNLVENKVKVDKDFLIKIFNKTEMFKKNKVAVLEYCFLATDLEEVIAFKLDKDGCIIAYSKLLVEEEIEVLEYGQSMNKYDLKYDVVKKLKPNYFKTRKELVIRNYIIKQIKETIKNNDVDKLKYLYFDCFKKNIKKDNLIHNIYKDLEDNWDNVYLKVFDFFKMTTSKR
ncbi:MAG: DUF3603 family protein [Bacilli bacterium]